MFARSFSTIRLYSYSASVFAFVDLMYRSPLNIANSMRTIHKCLSPLATYAPHITARISAKCTSKLYTPSRAACPICVCVCVSPCLSCVRAHHPLARRSTDNLAGATHTIWLLLSVSVVRFIATYFILFQPFHLFVVVVFCLSFHLVRLQIIIQCASHDK